MKTRSSIATAALLGLFACTQAYAATEYSPLLRSKKFAEAEKLANARLAQEPANAEAIAAKVDAILGAGPASRIDEAVKLGEQCVASHPQVATCHLAMGNALGSKAMNAGIMSAMGYAGTIRDAFKKAVELDPHNADARFSLLQYYVQAPALVGGAKGKAQALAAQTATLMPEASKLMFVELDIAEEQYAKAEASLMALQPSSDDVIADKQRDLFASLGFHYLTDKKYADCERVFRVLQKRFPDSENGPYGLGRSLQQQGRHREAIAGFEQAAGVRDQAYIHYRIGQAAQALGDKVRATSEYARALTLKSGLSKTMEADAQTQLKNLRG
jgi:tetratricopeptide (TPR) repeat protein